MKNVNIFGVHWKIQLVGWGGGGGEFTINQYRGGLPKKRAWTVFKFKGQGAWQEKGDGVFEGGWYPNAHFGIVICGKTGQLK